MPRNESWLLKLLARALSLRRSEAMTLGSGRSFRQFLRFAALFSLSIIVPAGLLSVFALRSIQAEELQVDADLQRRADALALEVHQELQQTFDKFERQTSDRLLHGQSPLANLAELSPYLRAAFRFDAEGRLVAPFTLSDGPLVREPSTFYQRQWTAGSRAERAGRWDEALKAYRTAAATTSDPSLSGEAEYAAARVLASAGHVQEADQALADVYAARADVRDRWGFRIGDLATLKRAELAMSHNPDVGRVALESLVEQLLSDRWSVGHPGEAAVARRALHLLDGRSDPDWLGRMKTRLTERTSQLFWAGQLKRELVLFQGDVEHLDRGRFRYVMRSEKSPLWATLWLGNSLYVFSFDYGSIVTDLRADLQRSARLDDELFAQVLPLGDQTPEGTLKRRRLAPWAPYQFVVVGMKNPASIVGKKIRMRRTRMIIVLLAVSMSVLGVFLSLRLVRNELEGARMKTDFAANVSHELRSPITQIRLKAESLQLDLVYDDDDRRAHYDAIVHEAERLSRLVDNVLDFAAIERGAKRYTFRPEDAPSILYQAIEAAQSDFESREVAVEAEIPEDLPVVWCNREAIGQVMTNLLSNAAKYGADGDWVGVRAHQEGDMVEVSVADRGLGIDPEDQARIFDHFYRSASAAVRRRKGTGIGLSIVRYIVEAHGGTITVDSTPGEGTTFTFTLPLENPEEPTY